MKRFEVAAWGFFLGAFIVSTAAASRPQINPDEAYKVQFEYDLPAPPDKFRLWYDGGIVKNYTNAEVRLGKKVNVDGTITFTLSAPGLNLKEHTYFISVIHEDGTEERSETMQIQPQCTLYQVVKK